MTTWVRRNLFRTPLDGVVTVVFTTVAAFAVYKAITFVFVTGRWDIVRANLSFLLYGRFPDTHLLRLSVALALLTLWGGLIAGLIHGRRIRTGTAMHMSPRRRAIDLLERFWIPAVAVLLLLALATTIGPWITVLAAVATGVVGRIAGSQLGRLTLGRLGGSLLAVVIAGLPIGVYLYVIDALGADLWGGFMINMFIAVCSIVLCFPLGVLLALGRAAGHTSTGTINSAVSAVALAIPMVLVLIFVVDRSPGEPAFWLVIAGTVVAAAWGWHLGQRSTLPLIRVASIAYIEIIRGAPLYVLLLLANVALQFFLPAGVAPSTTTRAIVVFTLFTAAYMAEIIRGGLQSVPPGQSEAAKALGLTPARETFLIVMPQALRNVIPAQIGQLISLFKDTSLAGAAMGMFELLNVAEGLPSQREFSLDMIGEALAIAAFLFWVVSYTMSRESQRLERRLGVGTR